MNDLLGGFNWGKNQYWPSLAHFECRFNTQKFEVNDYANSGRSWLYRHTDGRQNRDLRASNSALRTISVFYAQWHKSMLVNKKLICFSIF